MVSGSNQLASPPRSPEVVYEYRLTGPTADAELSTEPYTPYTAYNPHPAHSPPSAGEITVSNSGYTPRRRKGASTTTTTPSST